MNGKTIRLWLATLTAGTGVAAVVLWSLPGRPSTDHSRPETSRAADASASPAVRVDRLRLGQITIPDGDEASLDLKLDGLPRLRSSVDLAR